MPNILYIEDDELSATMVIRALKNEGHHVEIAATALAGIELARQNLPDLILMDMWLPGGIDGWNAVELIKGDSQLAHIPIIGISAQSDHNARDRALAAGCVSYILKPFKIQEFLEVVNASLG